MSIPTRRPNFPLTLLDEGLEFSLTGNKKPPTSIIFLICVAAKIRICRYKKRGKIHYRKIFFVEKWHAKNYSFNKRGLGRFKTNSFYPLQMLLNGGESSGKNLKIPNLGRIII
mmetsp:Transcript_6126/g.9341  ORF Transcript_6126/g.9341 Transcript_6126/m.9341 type:complete len:113 (+) Transcript_6126:2857-3195(+)